MKLIQKHPKRAATIIVADRIKISASRWPWQKVGMRAALCSDSERKMERYGWRGTDGMGRFGGGWNWCLGFRIGGSSIYIELLWGAITISKPSAKYRDW